MLSGLCDIPLEKHGSYEEEPAKPDKVGEQCDENR